MERKLECWLNKNKQFKVEKDIQMKTKKVKNCKTNILKRKNEHKLINK